MRQWRIGRIQIRWLDKSALIRLLELEQQNEENDAIRAAEAKQRNLRTGARIPEKPRPVSIATSDGWKSK